jgi:hypothetical protein
LACEAARLGIVCEGRRADGVRRMVDQAHALRDRPLIMR